MPVTWNGYLNMTGIDALAKLKPAEVTHSMTDSRRNRAVLPAGSAARPVEWHSMTAGPTSSETA